MKEIKIRESIIDIFTSYVYEQVFSEYELKEYCVKWNLRYEEVSTDKYRVRNLEGEQVLYRFKSANDKVAALREVLKIFYNKTEIEMLYEAARHVAEGKLRTCYKKCDDKAALYEKMVKAAVEADEPTVEDYDSQANAEAGISDESDTPYDSTSQAIYGRRYRESVREDGVTPEQMNTIDDAIQKAYEESAQ